MGMGGEVKSIAIKFANVDEVTRQLDLLMPRLSLNIYAGIGDSIYRYSSVEGNSSKGPATVFIPVIIASSIVLNTMLGSVFEEGQGDRDILLDPGLLRTTSRCSLSRNRWWTRTWERSRVTCWGREQASCRLLTCCRVCISISLRCPRFSRHWWWAGWCC